MFGAFSSRSVAVPLVAHVGQRLPRQEAAHVLDEEVQALKLRMGSETGAAQ